MSFEQHAEEKRLQEIVNDPTASDYDKAHAANRLAHGIWHRLDYAQSLTYGLLAQQLFEKIHDPFNVADSIFAQGDAHYGLKAYSDAFECYSKAANIFRTEVNQIFLARSVQRGASCLEELQQPKQAADGYLEAAKLFLSTDDFDSASWSFYSAAQELNKIGEHEQAELYATQSLDFAEKAEDDSNLPMVYYTRAKALGLQGNCEAAVADLIEGIHVAKYQDSTGEIGLLNHYLAEMYFEQELLDEAESAVGRAQEAFTKATNAVALAYCDLVLAKIFDQKGMIFPAIEKVQECRKLVKFSDRELGFDADWLFARLNAKMDELPAAIEAFEVAAKSLQALSKVHKRADEFWIEYADLLIQTPNHASCIEKLDQVKFVENLTPHARIRYYALRSRAHLLLSQYDQALELVDVALAAIGDDTAHPLLGYVLETKARTLCDSGDLGEGLSVMQNAVNAHLISGSAESARYLAIELRNLSNPKQDSAGSDSSDLTLWGDENQAA